MDSKCGVEYLLVPREAHTQAEASVIPQDAHSEIRGGPRVG